MTQNTRRRILTTLSGGVMVALAGCFGSEDDPEGNTGDNQEDDGDNGSGEDGNGDDEESDSGEDEPAAPEELESPDPVDWTDQSQATIEVGPSGERRFEPDAVLITPGTKLRWLWGSDGHTLVPTNQPDGAEWEGVTEAADAGYEVEFTPETTGEYRYVSEVDEDEMVGFLVAEE